MAEKKESKECCCNDTTLTKTRGCLQCKIQETVPLDHFERTSRCDQHYMSVAMCGGGFWICDSCTEEGYYYEPALGFGMPKVLKKTKINKIFSKNDLK